MNWVFLNSTRFTIRIQFILKKANIWHMLKKYFLWGENWHENTRYCLIRLYTAESFGKQSLNTASYVICMHIQSVTDWCKNEIHRPESCILCLNHNSGSLNCSRDWWMAMPEHCYIIFLCVKNVHQLICFEMKFFFDFFCLVTWFLWINRWKLCDNVLLLVLLLTGKEWNQSIVQYPKPFFQFIFEFGIV